jgi:hypothetical protein
VRRVPGSRLIAIGGMRAIARSSFIVHRLGARALPGDAGRTHETYASQLPAAGRGRKLAGLGQEIYPVNQQTPESLTAFQKAEIDKWGPIITAANIKVE